MPAIATMIPMMTPRMTSTATPMASKLMAASYARTGFAVWVTARGSVVAADRSIPERPHRHVAGLRVDHFVPEGHESGARQLEVGHCEGDADDRDGVDEGCE